MKSRDAWARLRGVRLRWPVWVWVMIGVWWFVVLMAMAWRTMNGGIGRPVTGVIRAAPFVLRREDALRGRDAARLTRDAALSGLEAVREWRRWMDSLRTSAGGMAIYDSILQVRPGLEDSAKEVEDYYLQLLK